MGGKDAEKEERQKWDNAEHKKIMDSVNSLLERRNRYIAEHQQPNSEQDNANANANSSETVELVDSNIFENEDEKNLSSEDVNLEANESKEEKLNHKNDVDEVVDESHEDSDGFIEVKINKNLREKESIFSNKIETKSDQGKPFSFGK